MPTQVELKALFDSAPVERLSMTPESQKELEALFEAAPPLTAQAEEKPVLLEDLYSLDRPYESAGNVIGAAVEPMMKMGSGMVGSTIGGLSGIGTGMGNALGLDLGDPQENIEYFQDAMTYQPRSEGGKIASEAIEYPFKKMEEGAEVVGQENVNITGSPAVGAAAKTTMMMLPAIVGAGGAKKAMPPEAKPSALAETIASPVTMPLNAAGATLKFVKNAIVNRFPKGAERATVDTIDKMLGDRFPTVVELLKRAEKGQTAGQAATKAGSMEFSALQKFAEQIDPSGFQAMMKSQREGRLKDLTKDFGKTPEELARAKENLAREAEIKYAKSRDDIIEPKSIPLKEQLLEENLPNALKNQAGIPDSMVTPSTAKPAILQKQAGVDYPVNLGDFLEKPSIKRGVKKAREILAEQGKDLPSNPNQWTVADVQLIKRTVADEMNLRLSKEAGEKGIGRTEAKAVTDTKKLFTDFIRERSKKFAEAEDFYAAESKPITQMEAGQALAKGLGKETNLPQSRKGMEKVWDNLEKKGKTEDLTQSQKTSVEKISEAIMNDEVLKYQSGKGYPALNKEMGAVLGDLPNPLDRRIMIIKAILKRIEGKNTKDTNKLLSDGMKDPAFMAKLMEKAIEKRKMKSELNKFKAPTVVGGAIIEAENK